MSHTFEHRCYVIIASGDASLVDFNEVLETSLETLRYSVDGSLTFVKYEGEMPQSVLNIGSKQGPYSHAEILEILSTEIWTAPMEIV